MENAANQQRFANGFKIFLSFLHLGTFFKQYHYWKCFNIKQKKCWTQIKVIVLIVTVAAIILFIIQLTSLPSFDKSMILEIQNSFEVQVRAVRSRATIRKQESRIS